MIYTGRIGELFELATATSEHHDSLMDQELDALKIIWFKSSAKLLIDQVEYTFLPNQFLFLTHLHTIEPIHLTKAEILRFNRPFYCVIDHDSEVGCKGVLFYGAAGKIPIITLADMSLDIMRTVWHLCHLEFQMQDDLQQEMLQMMLKRILILSTRSYRLNSDMSELNDEHSNLVREYNYLVELHFREMHSVGDYAKLLYKSPKTISNSFKKMGHKTPLQYIHDRLLLEARRLLWYTNKDISQIAYELGFNELQTFSRFFKKNEGKSPSEFRQAGL